MEIVLLEDLGCSTEILQTNGEKLEKAGHKFTVFDKNPDKEILKARVRDADVIMLANMPLPESVLDAAKKVQFIDVAFTGVDHLPMQKIRERGITVSNASGYANDSVAELAVSMMIQLLRDLPQAERNVRNGGTKNGLRANLLKDKIVGIIGAGSIGKTVAKLCKAFGAKVIAHNRKPVADPYIDANVSLDELLKEADIVTLHCPLTQDTKGLIGKKELALMKKGGFLINASRGGVVDNQALTEALNEETIAGAAIDVFDMEPPLPANYPLLEAKNAILTPHLGFYTKEALNQRAQIIFKNLFGWLHGKPENVVC